MSIVDQRTSKVEADIKQCISVEKDLKESNLPYCTELLENIALARVQLLDLSSQYHKMCIQGAAHEADAKPRPARRP